MSGPFLGRTSTKQSLNCLAQSYKAVPLVGLKPAIPRSRPKQESSTLPLSHQAPQPLVVYHDDGTVKPV